MEAIIKEVVQKTLIDVKVLKVLDERKKPRKKTRTEAFLEIVSKINKGIEIDAFYSDYPTNIAASFGWYRKETVEFINDLDAAGAIKVYTRKNRMLAFTFGEAILSVTEKISATSKEPSCDH